ncbi:MAG TPA: hypothetical protein VK364_01360 [Hymenobacter sp.]|nr:hypothetical protein [Hymenobacter sp.]
MSIIGGIDTKTATLDPRETRLIIPTILNHTLNNDQDKWADSFGNRPLMVFDEQNGQEIDTMVTD